LRHQKKKVRNRGEKCDKNIFGTDTYPGLGPIYIGGGGRANGKEADPLTYGGSTSKSERKGR